MSMTIYVACLDGRRHVFEVWPSDKVESIAAKVQEKEGISPDQQRLIYAGKLLNSSERLDSYNIGPESTLHLLRSKNRSARVLPSNIPRESLFQTGQKAYTNNERVGGFHRSRGAFRRHRHRDLPEYVRMESGSEAYTTTREWKDLADQFGFDADTHIVDPQAHYAALDSLEHTVVTSSELYCRSEVYRLGNSGNAVDFRDWTRISRPRMFRAPGWIHDLALDLHEDGNSGASDTVASLCETYLIVLSVLNSFDLLKLRQFCTSFFSILVERFDGIVAEIVKINETVLVELKEALEAAITVTRKETTDPGSAQKALTDSVGPAVQGFIDLLDCPQLGTDALVINTIPEMLNLCRMVACILDLGLVCYVGSHGVRFDTEYFQRSMDPLRFDLGNKLSFDCSLRDLACLDSFLDAKSVWVFRAGVNLAPAVPQGKNQKKLSILTTIDALADIWGPVWAEAVDQGIVGENPTRIKKYHVSKGVIRRVQEGVKPTVPGAVKCHWYSWTQDYRRRFSTLLTKPKDLSMALDDKLLIGSDIQINRSCAYTLDEYEMDYNHIISSLGPKPSTWKLDSAAVTVQLAAPKVVTFQIQGNVKKIPATTVKQFIWEKWNFKPEGANPGMLNNCFGVEISHCTGNARRIPMKQIFLMKPMQELLERQIPNWRYTQWGTAFYQVLQTESNHAVFQFWNTHTAARPLVGQLVRSVLDVLDGTGRTDSGFRAAFVHENFELGVDLPICKNEWVGLLKDSYLMATYAVVNEVCLECRRPNHTTSICGNESRYTVLQTQIGLKRGSSPTERLKIEPHSQTYKEVDDNEAAGRPYFMTPESSIKRTILLNYNLAVAKELLIHQPYDGNVHTAKLILRASGRSYGGMSYKRDRTPLSRADGVGIGEIDDTAATQEALRQVEIRDIEAVVGDETQVQQTQGQGNVTARVYR